MSPIPAQAAASIGGRSFDLTASVTSSGNDAGVLWATGTENSGISLFVQDRRLVVDYNAFDDHAIVESTIEVPPGRSELGLRVRRTGVSTGRLELIIDGRAAGSADLGLFMRMISSVGVSIGRDHGSAVSRRYTSPFAFTGILHDVSIDLVARAAPGTDDASARSEMSRQ